VTFALVAALATPLLAQSEERQQPFDSAGRLVVITPDLAARLGLHTLLPVAAGYRVARLYHRADSTYVVEFVLGTGALERRVRYDVSAELVAQLRTATRAAQLTAQVERRFQEGRPSLIRSSVVLGLGFYGWAVPAVLNVDDARGAGSLYFLTSGASFFVPYLATRTTDVTRATANLYWYGATRGILVGALTSNLINPDASGRTTLGFAVGGSLLGSTIGAMYGRTAAWSHAEAAGASAYGDLGAIAGATLGLATGLFSGDATNDDRGGNALVLGGLGAGILLGPMVARHEAYGEGDAAVVLNGALLGMGVATTFLVANDEDNDHVSGGALFAGELLGAFAGNRLARSVTLTEGQGTITRLAMLGGALVGFGLAYVGASDDANGAVYIGAATAGGTAAMLVVLSSYRDQPRVGLRPANPRSPALTLGPGFVNLSF
jgi:hypothetical protein